MLKAMEGRLLIVATGSIRDRLLFEELKTLHVPDVSPQQQVVICEHMRRIDEEITGLLKRIAEEKGGAVQRLHELVKPPSPDTASPEREQ